jgi:hypothetical protein
VRHRERDVAEPRGDIADLHVARLRRRRRARVRQVADRPQRRRLADRGAIAIDPAVEPGQRVGVERGGLGRRQQLDVLARPAGSAADSRPPRVAIGDHAQSKPPTRVARHAPIRLGPRSAPASASGSRFATSRHAGDAPDVGAGRT